MIKLGGPTKMLDNGKFENISLILINTINNLSNKNKSKRNCLKQ